MQQQIAPGQSAMLISQNAWIPALMTHQEAAMVMADALYVLIHVCKMMEIGLPAHIQEIGVITGIFDKSQNHWELKVKKAVANCLREQIGSSSKTIAIALCELEKSLLKETPSFLHLSIKRVISREKFTHASDDLDLDLHLQLLDEMLNLGFDVNQEQILLDKIFYHFSYMFKKKYDISQKIIIILIKGLRSVKKSDEHLFNHYISTYKKIFLKNNFLHGLRLLEELSNNF